MSTPRLFSRKTAAGFALVAAAACSVLPQSRSSLQEHMAFHFGEVARVRAALVEGDLEGAREPARAIWLQTDHPDLPRGVDSPAHDLRRAAHRTAAATTLEEAARATGDMGAACARCHRAADAGPALRVELPPRGDSEWERMLRHDWGARRMWEAIVADDQAVWVAGAEALGEAPLLPADSEDHPGMEVLAREVRDLAREARRIEKPAGRAGLYGRLLSTCSGCHVLLESTEE